MSCDGTQLLMLAALQLRAAFDDNRCCIRQRVIAVIICIIIKLNRAFDNVVATLKVSANDAVSAPGDLTDGGLGQHQQRTFSVHFQYFKFFNRFSVRSLGGPSVRM